jgi:hypothetical protein
MVLKNETDTRDGEVQQTEKTTLRGAGCRQIQTVNRQSEWSVKESKGGSMIMKDLFKVAAILFFLLWMTAPASADSFRYGSKLVCTGETKADVLTTCGEPMLKEIVAERTTWNARRRGVSSCYGSSTTVPVEQWIYDMGPCRFPRILTFYGSTLVSIERGDKP